ncbi:LOW QUALITY PROTEIN: protein NRT1/ PTR FAMILY 1.2 [Solanum lycopersicum]|uniref:LOW QUALITY PROTEIN: protein NRT1/ PTR FAMILY 1.2 n=1 Tax=Solanum lycopersicum TaxID=4081 RepID=UPI0008FEB26A|nr:LOW QUALITY PROTEIN: protein NRT1/ PTR FAMILY 1.2 [Solanum lycopersicum]
MRTEIRQVEEQPRKGGLRTMPFIIVNESFEMIATYGLQTNMLIYLMTFYNMSAATATTILGLWAALSNGMAIVGAIVADSYCGRFRAVAFGSISTLIGMIVLWLTTMIPELTSLSCSHFQHVCNGTTPIQLAVLFSSFGFMSIGAGFVRPCSIIFGADQLEDKKNPENQRRIASYFNWYYVSTGISTMLAVTVIIYIQDRYGWQIGFGIPIILMFLSVLMFQLGSPLYIKVKAKETENLIIGLFQAAVAAFSKRNNTRLPLTGCDEYYRWPLESNASTPSMDFRWLNRACMIEDPERDLNADGSASNPWDLCSVERVESLKALIRILPMWSTGFMMSVDMGVFSFSILQTKTMDRHMFPHFEIPAASFTMFLLIALTIWIIFYDRILVPLLSKYTGRSRGLSPVTRMRIGLVVSCMSMALSAITERIRRQKAIEEGHEDEPNALVNMSAMWFVPQYALLGMAEAAHTVGQIEFFYSLLPKSMSSFASAMHTVGSAVSSLIGSIMVSSVDWLSSTGGKTSWLSNNINKGHLDYHFWVLASMSFLNLLHFLVVCRFYETGNDEINRSPHVADDRECDYRLLHES